MATQITVGICTYNGAKRLPQVLDRLKAQVNTKKINWEVIVIDNNSQDETPDIVREYQNNWIPDVPLRYCFESRQGLAIARQRAIEEAEGELVGFLDDDNLPRPNWLIAAWDFAQAYPQVGAYGSRIYGNFEATPPPNFNRISSFLALTDRGTQARIYKPEQKILPPGAGLVIRKEVWLEKVPKKCFLQGRVAGCKLPGEDLEAVLYIQKAGWEIWYNPAMEVEHQIPSHRLDKQQLLNLFRGIGLSRYHTRMLSFGRWQWPFMLPLYLANDTRKLLIHLLKHGKKVQSDTVIACEMQLFLCSLLSPFYLGRQYLRQNVGN